VPRGISEGVIISSGELVRRNAAFAATGLRRPSPSHHRDPAGCSLRLLPSTRVITRFELGEGVVMRTWRPESPARRFAHGPAGPAWPGQPSESRAPGICPHRLRRIRLADSRSARRVLRDTSDELESKASNDPYAAVRVERRHRPAYLPPSRLVSACLRRQHRAHRRSRPGHPGVAALCKNRHRRRRPRRDVRTLSLAALPPDRTEPVDDVSSHSGRQLYDPATATTPSPIAVAAELPAPPVEPGFPNVG